MTEIEKLQTKLRKQRANGDYLKALITAKEIEKLTPRVEQVSLKSLVDDMPTKDRTEIIQQMHKMFILADILNGYAIDFQSLIKKQDKTLSLPVCNNVRQAAKMLQNAVNTVDSVGNLSLSETFGDISDRVSMVITNELNATIARNR